MLPYYFINRCAKNHSAIYIFLLLLLLPRSNYEINCNSPPGTTTKFNYDQTIATRTVLELKKKMHI